VSDFLRDETLINEAALSLYEMGEYEQGFSLLRQFISDSGGSADARTFIHLALFLAALGRGQDERALYCQLYERGVRDLSLLVNYAVSLGEAEQFETSRLIAEEAKTRFPDSAEGFEVLGNALANLEDRAEAAESFGLYITKRWSKPEALAANLVRLVNVDPISAHPDERAKYRELFERTLSNCLEASLTLESSQVQQLRWAAFKVSRTYLAYGGLNDRQINSLHARFLEKIFERPSPADAQHFLRPERYKFSVGVVTTGRYHHELFCSLQVSELDLGSVELTYIFLNCSHRPKSQPAGAKSEFIRYSLHTHDTVVEQIRAHAFDVVFFPEIGMSIECQILSSLRLGARAFTTWLHPVTSGSRHVDTFLSSSLMEPVGFEDHYTEQVRMQADLGLVFPNQYFNRPSPSLTRTEAAHDRGERLVCLQTPFKILSEHDEVYLAILLRNPRATLTFVEAPVSTLSHRFIRRLRGRARYFGRDCENLLSRVYLVPRVPSDDLLNWLGGFDLAVDGLSWSGGNTTLDCLRAGLPVVTLRGNFLRSRHTAGIYSKIADPLLSSCLVADDFESFVDLISDALSAKKNDELRTRIHLGFERLRESKSGPLEYIGDLLNR